jgi:2-dehydro-3-deoxyphosphogluconate aldolase/(4S)-4-hydroxy-2-oxoglutarate aldolase
LQFVVEAEIAIRGATIYQLREARWNWRIGMTVEKGAISCGFRDKTLVIIRRTGLIPIVRVASREQAICAVEGIAAAGLPIVEITLTIPNALQIIEELAKRFEDGLLIGAGTVLNVESCQSALSAGAKFIVSPTLNLGVIELAQHHDSVCIPGALTPNEVLAAWVGGADLVKIFPCGFMGGPQYISALKAPFPQVQLVPTAGVTVENIAEFIAAGATAVGVGEKIFDRDALQQGNVGLIAARARRFMDAVQSAIR